jgi:histidinol-phosphate aminotransferase
MSTLFENLNHGINELHPYEPGRSIEEVVAEYKPERVVKLASNENPLGSISKGARGNTKLFIRFTSIS